MITAKRLRELLERLPDDAALVAYEGEGIGLRVFRGYRGSAERLSGWIETGHDERGEVLDSEHDLTDFTKGDTNQ